MKSLLLFLLLSLSSSTFAHEYFFAFVELDFNEEKKLFEATLTASAHDVEDVLNEVGISIKELEDHYTDKVMIEKLESFITKQFQVNSNGNVAFKLIGFEVNKQGLVNFYLSSNTTEVPSKEITIKFDFLMDQLDQQQNKLTFITEPEAKTVVFLQNSRTQTIVL
ncbi:MAG: DUF6702 family protein [Fluviicola sp.]|jgi:hypothetical protein